MLDKHYNFSDNEKSLYAFWEESGFFSPKEKGESYCITLPPPNVTGRLHMGHALNFTLQDILIRQKRMQGFSALWVPGVDHGGISTHSMVEKQLAKEGLTRFKIGRPAFEKRVLEWKEEYGGVIFDQARQLGASLDWTRSRYTMDAEYTKAIHTAFIHYYNKGWIYQGKRTVNWCTKCQTSISDLEIEWKDNKGKLYYIKYPIKDSSEFIVVATTRPETMLGDTAVAVNPKDIKYKDLIGKEIELPLTDRVIKVIADDFVDAEFGTGAVKITPAHDLNDYQSGLRNKLETVDVIDKYGKMTYGKYEGMKVDIAREEIIKDLGDLILKVEPYDNQHPHCSRCHRVIENIPSEQWFLKMDELADLAKNAVKEGKVKFVPKNWEKTYFAWLENLRDWCISRQLWWGHQMPVYKKGDEIYVGTEPPEDYIQIEDVFDTWFSSALWPFVVLGWPEKTPDFEKFFPTNILSTARDIINLWVTRMVFSSLELTGKIPFTDVIIHPTILAKDGRRMSKSLGTGIDPIELIDKYGADATRMGLAWQATELQDVKFAEDSIIAGRKFVNKIWNASRFVLMQIGDDCIDITKAEVRNDSDKVIAERLNNIIESCTKDLESYKFAKTIRDIYEFFWHDFCDKYIEEQKESPNKEMLMNVLLSSLKLLHPFMPFVTEEIYKNLNIKNKQKALIIETWPQKKDY